MDRKFNDGDEVVHKSDKAHRMTVISYTSDGKVACRWKGKKGFENEEFLEAELEKYDASANTISVGWLGTDPKDSRW